MSVTSKNYNGYQKAYAFFNRKLFSNSLPDCIITLQRVNHAYGYFWHSQFVGRQSDDTVDEIALNPDLFVGRPDIDILSTLVHEMCHVWQQYNGTPSRVGYHNREWANKMLEIGLTPSDTGLVGGKQTGQSMSHVIEQDGLFTRAYRRLVSQRGFTLSWEARGARAKGDNNDGSNDNDTDDGDSKKSPKSSKTKFTCQLCNLNAWAKPGAVLVCGHCLSVNPISGLPIISVMQSDDSVKTALSSDYFDLRG